MCHVVLSHDTDDVLLSNVGDKSGDVNVSITVYLSFDAAYETPADSSIPVTNKYHSQRYLKYLAKLYHNYKSDQSADIKYI